ncbi:hypothetical protein MHYP_G00200930 [Metynnis hypsauchen]
MASDKPGSVLLPAGLPIRSMRTKFAVLVGLIQAGEVTDRDIAETVLNLVQQASMPLAISSPHAETACQPQLFTSGVLILVYAEGNSTGESSRVG